MRLPTLHISIPKPAPTAKSAPIPMRRPAVRNSGTTPLPFNESVPAGSTINLGTCTGLGDIIWVYQKFAPYFDKINLTVLSTSGSEVGERSMKWLKLLPQVGVTSFRVERAQDYQALATSPCTMAETVWKWHQNPTGRIDYSCNKWLEEGVRLDEIDPGSVVQADVPILSVPFTLPRPRYAILYVSGDTRHQWLHNNGSESIWSVSKWVDYVKRLWARWGLDLPVIVLGASYDEGITVALFEMLKMEGMDVGIMLGQEPGKVVHLIKNADLFIGYQSGLSIVADILNTMQVMLWFPRLEKMQHTFCKRGHENTRFFSSLFSQTPEQVVEQHELDLRPAVASEPAPAI